ncbi:TonB family protein [Komarekiella sp. 'clone 1']|uniref:TonB family protein n=1 Tax=Komarekiella delphini-convector SJRDD-AB1 TaxID=2593771 RepID=A0AA40SZ63_9NOST|nr:TonB family protein [Komarekiella delphini-convector]MBD6617683.1 TonB family protein [Komarekiella delphini-convector SJRDD-AB1]
MAKSHQFQLDRNKPTELLFCLFTSILLHFILFIAGNYWLRSVASEQRQASSQAIPIEYVEVPPDETKTPKKTSKRAANNSIGKGQVSRPNNLSAPKPAKAFPPKLAPSAPTAPTVVTPATTPAKIPPRKLAVAPTIAPTAPTVVTPATTPAKIPPRKLAVAPTIAPTAPTVVTPAATPAKIPPRKLAVTPTTAPTAPTVVTPAATPAKIPPRKLAVAPTTTPTVPSPTSEQLENSATPRKPQVQPALKSGAASRLGGPVSLSSRDFGGNYFAASPNSNRFNPDSNGVDARQDTDLGPYLKELQRQVRQQWIPEVTQSSRRSVLHFTINRSGQVSNLRIARTSGFNVTDEAAVSAVKRAAPFIPLPTTYRGNNISIEFTFVINVYGELDLQGNGQK